MNSFITAFGTVITVVIRNDIVSHLLLLSNDDDFF